MIELTEQDQVDEANALSTALYKIIAHTQPPDNFGMTVTLNALAAVCGAVLARTVNNDEMFHQFCRAVRIVCNERLGME